MVAPFIHIFIISLSQLPQEFSKGKNEDQEHPRTPNQTQEEKATEDSISNSRKRQAESPLRLEDSADRVGKGRQWEGSSKQVSSHKVCLFFASQQPANLQIMYC